MKNMTRGNYLPMGATPLDNNRVQFVVPAEQGKEYNLILYYRKKGHRQVISLKEEYRRGNVYSLIVEGIKNNDVTYNLEINGQEKTDPYAKMILGRGQWGRESIKKVQGGIFLADYDWQEDQAPGYSMEDIVLYQLHVRGFTKHASSGVKKKGTFEGIIEKLPYLKELGVTTLELLPAYEFSEIENSRSAAVSMEDMKQQGVYGQKEEETRINYWGYKEAFYFVPKASYSGGKDSSHSFKNLVKELHKQGMEIMMQFFFPINISRAFIFQVLQFWIKEYHVDGFRLMGVNIPAELIASMDEFCNTKILYETMEENLVYGYQKTPCYFNLASYNDSYMYSLRKFLKSDVGSLQQAFHDMINGGNRIKRVIYMTNYNTFTLHDLVSYDRKHNEKNGEMGSDGNNHNVSWNCGAEGDTKKKQVLQLRKRQMKNALTLLFFSKGTPVLLAGDEFCNSQKGNNNPYCQDNSISWLNWKDLEKNKEHFDFCRWLIQLRKQNKLYDIEKLKILEGERERLPAISFHGKEAWKLDWSTANEEAGGILYYLQNGFLYLAINMHWESTNLALPSLPLEGDWKVILNTGAQEEDIFIDRKKKVIKVPPRTIVVLEAKRKEQNGKGITAF